MLIPFISLFRRFLTLYPRNSKSWPLGQVFQQLLGGKLRGALVLFSALRPPPFMKQTGGHCGSIFAHQYTISVQSKDPQDGKCLQITMHSARLPGSTRVWILLSPQVGTVRTSN